MTPGTTERSPNSAGSMINVPRMIPQRPAVILVVLRTFMRVLPSASQFTLPLENLPQVVRKCVPSIAGIHKNKVKVEMQRKIKCPNFLISAE